MQKSDFSEGAEWAYRSQRQLGSPAKRVKLLFMPNRKGQAQVKVRFLDGEVEGLEEFVKAIHLICPWKQWAKIERDEKKEDDFYEYMSQQPEVDSAVIRAAREVLLASGEDLYLDDYRNFDRLYSSQVKGLERLADRIKLEHRPWQHAPCFKNVNGDIYAPIEMLIEVAIAFAKAEPETVNLRLEMEEAEYVQRGYGLGESYYHKELLNKKPSFALAREWAKREEGRDYLKEELERVTYLLNRAIGYLKDLGETRKVGLLERELRKS
jgi:hypothetical protein